MPGVDRSHNGQGQGAVSRTKEPNALFLVGFFKGRHKHAQRDIAKDKSGQRHDDTKHELATGFGKNMLKLGIERGNHLLKILSKAFFIGF